MKIKHQRSSKVVEINTTQLIVDILNLDSNEHRWRRECEIIVDYMPPNPGKDTKPTCVIYHPPTECFVRYSHGPVQGYFWDAYGDDFMRPEIAIVALSRCQKPWGKPYVEFKIPLKIPLKQ